LGIGIALGLAVGAALNTKKNKKHKKWLNFLVVWKVLCFGLQVKVYKEIFKDQKINKSK
jgi:hypothetical protein